ncbi:riboflavin synthase subunit beta [Mesonia sediminis]|jgi:hypothetical protein|uniref:Riboflavin synthase subunit beta n=1 Tax=Mesonia sediminis TaxID=1703946 RepID=A0ABW5SDC1_9FLAO|nr:riboflavin synthase subunit beta [Mesonia sp. HuA40]TXK74346.1 riboflavin synthase subunit beta [Mesonia sp. HuA40]
MGILKRRKNKQFSYKPRYYDDKGEGSPYKIKTKYDQFRKTTGNPLGFVGNVKSALAELKEKDEDQTSRKRILLIVAILIFLFLLFIEFDLSIFLPE